MFESIGEKFQNIFRKIRGKARLSEKNMADTLAEIRLVLLDADVNYKVTKTFLKEVEEKAIGLDVYNKVNPSQMLIKVIQDEMISILGGTDNALKLVKSSLNTIMMCGLQGSGKTTSVAKLTKHLMKNGYPRILVAACDTYRPGAYDQLNTIVTKAGGTTFYLEGKDPVEIASKALEKARLDHFNVLIIDTAGRLHIDEKLMDELIRINEATKPGEILFTIDAMSGQDGVNVAASFKAQLPITGAIITKFDSEARSGVALSVRYLTGIPIKFLGIGERADDLEVFHPDRMADRILGMGDVVTLVEKAKEHIDEKKSKKALGRMMSGKFNLDDLLEQMKQVQKMGSLKGIFRLIPGMPKVSDEDLERGQREIYVNEILINSMTFDERINPDLLKHSRKQRIVYGSGRSIQELNKLLKKFDDMKEMMKKMKNQPGGFNGKLPF